MRTRVFNISGKEVFPPRPLNIDDEPEAPRLRIVVTPPGHFLLAETSPQIATAPRTAPLIAGGAIPIVADDAPFVSLANGVVAQPLNDALQIPTFFSADEFPEPVAEVVELDVSEQLSAPVATVSPSADTGIRQPTRPLSAVEQEALRDEVRQSEERNRERLKGVRTIPPEEAEEIVAAANGREIQRDKSAIQFVHPDPLVPVSKDKWINRRINQLVAWRGVHPADAEYQAESEWRDKHGPEDTEAHHPNETSSNERLGRGRFPNGTSIQARDARGEQHQIDGSKTAVASPKDTNREAADINRFGKGEIAPVAPGFSGRTYDLVVEIDGNVRRYNGVPVEWDLDTLLARAFPSVPVRHIVDGEDQTLQ